MIFMIVLIIIIIASLIYFGGSVSVCDDDYSKLIRSLEALRALTSELMSSILNHCRMFLATLVALQCLHFTPVSESAWSLRACCFP